MEITEFLELIFEKWWDKYQGIENEEETYVFFLEYFIHCHQLAGEKEEILNEESIKKLATLINSKDKENYRLGIEVLRSFQLKKEMLLDKLKDVCKQDYTRFFELFIEILNIEDRVYCVERMYEKVEKEIVKLAELLFIAEEEEKIALRNELEELENESEQINEELMSPTNRNRVYMCLENLVVEIIEYLLIDESDNEVLVRKIVSETSDKYYKKTRSNIFPV